MFGSGKTEISLNFAFSLKKHYEKVAIADIDTVSPYFRSRDEKNALEHSGIKVIVPREPFLRGDLPIIVPEVGGYLQNPDFRVVTDVGGDDDGATVLGSLSRFFDPKTVAIFVVNTRRPFSENVEEIGHNLERLTMKGRIKISYLIHNTHLVAETTYEMVRKGEEILRQVSEKTGIPVLATVITESLRVDIGNPSFYFPVMGMRRYMLQPWEE
jgi:hypothetical protein